MISVINGAGRVVYVSPSVTRFLGYSPAEFMSLGMLDVVHPDDQACVSAQMERAIGANEALEGEARVRHRDGSWRWLRGVMRSRLHDPAIAAIVCNFRDVTHEHATKALHQRLQDQSAYALDAAGAGIWDFDLLTGVVRWSDLTAALLGFAREDFEGTLDDFRRCVHPDDLTVVDAAIKRSLEQDLPYRVHFRVVWPDGSVHWLTAKGRVTRNGVGEPIEMMGIAIDITERKQLEQRLEQSQKMESLGLLAGSVAHDFNNVLTAILGYCELMLLDCTPSDPRAENLTEIRKAGESGKRLTRQLLAFSRQQTLEPTQVDINTIVRESEGILRQVIGSMIQLEIELNSEGRVWADAGQLQQILVNLAVNARDAMPKGGRLLIKTYEDHVARRGQDQEGIDGRHVMLAVTDNGSGMTPETKARIFDPFFTTKPPDKGTGLGLSTVYGIVQQSGGFIDVTSAVGRGTTFRVGFPVLEQTGGERGLANRPDSRAAFLL